MNRTDRLLTIVLELQGRDRVRAEDLARHLGVSKRTIYRDVLALNEAGVPVVSVPGQGYSLMPGYFLPPLQFSAEEAVMLLLGSDVTAQLFGGGPAEAARQASRKIGAVLDPAMRDEVAFLLDNLRLVRQGGGEEAQATRDKLRQLREAVTRRRVTRFSYHKPGSAAQTRQAEPHGLYLLGDVWLMAAFDQERRALRSFRVDRMEDLELLGDVFSRQPGFRLAREEARRDRPLAVRVLFAADRRREVRERLPFYTTGTQETPEGFVVTLRARTVQEVLPWLLSWGADAQVLSPAPLREHLRDEGRRLAQRYA
ncbi:YafY family protein [Deinococcus sp. Leaf326]|uniref:helix-turn-helix transcriptional regulator n=1 Tax=Deinococcus sp. Leaf326 TaxID=1736338 RepID=UPI0006FD6BEB|nr:YafY family protein [Deinococcus sp. Leaf326]KQR40707.1 hypothetical protein ASF71_00625 [Deinococcus sp. Leaf326]